MLLVLSGHEHFWPGHKNCGGANNIKCLFIRWPSLGFSAILGNLGRKNGQHPDMELLIIARRCSKCLCEKDDQRTYRHGPLMNA